jgi:hypothetical protein
MRIDVSRNVLLLFLPVLQKQRNSFHYCEFGQTFNSFTQGKNCTKSCDSGVIQVNATCQAMFLL